MLTERCPQCGLALPHGVPAWTSRLTVGQVMTRDPVTIGPEDSLARALELMRLHKIRRMPVILGGRLVGLLAEGDLKRAQPSTLSDSEEEFNRVFLGARSAPYQVDASRLVAKHRKGSRRRSRAS